MPNAALAVRFNCTLNEIYAKRTALGITRAKMGFSSSKPTKPTLAEAAPASTTESKSEPRTLPRIVANDLHTLLTYINTISQNAPELAKLGNEIMRLAKKYEAGDTL